jgi:hypothetical protein
MNGVEMWAGPPAASGASTAPPSHHGPGMQGGGGPADLTQDPGPDRAATRRRARPRLLTTTRPAASGVAVRPHGA